MIVHAVVRVHDDEITVNDDFTALFDSTVSCLGDLPTTADRSDDVKDLRSFVRDAQATGVPMKQRFEIFSYPTGNCIDSTVCAIATQSSEEVLLGFIVHDTHPIASHNLELRLEDAGSENPVIADRFKV